MIFCCWFLSIGFVGPEITVAPGQSIPAALAKLDGKPGTVTLAPGRHELPTPLHLTSAHSGITLRGPGATLSAGRLVRSWKANADGTWNAPLPDGVTSVPHLRVGEAVRQPRRTPTAGWHRMVAVPGLELKPSKSTRCDRFQFREGEIDPAWAGRGGEIVVLHYWVSGSYRLKAVEGSVSVLDRLSKRSFHEVTSGKAYARWYARNVPGPLAPGEFFADTVARTLTYRPATGEDLTRDEVIVPALSQVLACDGVKGATIEGLTLADAMAEPPAGSPWDEQGAAAVPGNVVTRMSRDVRFARCKFLALGGYGLECADGSQDIEVSRCEFRDLGAGGVKISGGTADSPQERRTGSVSVSDCDLVRLGRRWHAGIGILLMHADRCTIKHNHIRDLYYSGISVGWVWGYGPSVANNNRVEKNHIHTIGQGMLSDMGGVYTLGISPGTVVRGNVIHDIESFDYGGWGLYTDEGSTGIVMEGNLVYRTKSAGFHQHFGKDNIIRGNVFAFGRAAQLMRTRAEPHRSFTLEKNVVVWNSGSLFASNWTGDGFACDGNLYWRIGGTPEFPGGLAAWRKRGFDCHSEIADPGFRAPEQGDFTLNEGAKAREYIDPADWADAGVRK
ncbi:MAG: right-handed parallel beta-helix repeat-containing protein [Gemmataceae bacterium]|nr:right-handed parallel beta-helix repeat-containing protein [Gemmataceae bacterium]